MIEHWYKMLTSKSYHKHQWAARHLKNYRVWHSMQKLIPVVVAMLTAIEQFSILELQLAEYEEAQLDITR